MKYYNLPSTKNKIITTLIIVFVYGVAFYFMDTLFPGISIECKKKISQFGLLFIFIAGLFASLGFVWSAKVRHNLNIASLDIEQSEENLTICENLPEQVKRGLVDIISDNEQRFNEATKHKKEAEKFPKYLEFFGVISLFFLGLGTLLCIIGEG